jgi:aspartate carbamoyltransferase
MDHLLSVDQFSLEFLDEIFKSSKRMKEGHFNPRMLYGKLSTNLFYEPSSRTSSSFFSAMTRLGGSVIPINDVKYSSVSKGEDLEDTIRTMGCYSDIIIMRHNIEGSAAIAAAVSEVPIINAGDGKGEHPTQALLDYFTIRDKFKTLDGLNIAFSGDLMYGRTVHSLVKLLRQYDVTCTFIAPEPFQMPEEYVRPGDVITDSLYDIPNADVVYLTRVQKERHSAELDYEYKFTVEHLDLLKETSIIMHPLPRVGEISRKVDGDPRAYYFKQMQNGLYVRMALLKMFLG